MKAPRLIILAAGRGTRLGAAAQDRPKGLVPLAGRPLLAWHLAAARAAGLEDIVMVRGFHGEQLEPFGVRLVDNPIFARTNMVYSLWCAESLWTDRFIVAYADILYNPEVLAALAISPAETAVVIDRRWRAYWQERFADPLADAETLRLAEDGRITEIGQKPRTLEEIEGQYIGLSLFQGEGVAWLRKTIQTEMAAHAAGERRLTPHRVFPQLFMTDILQGRIDAGLPLQAVGIDGGWIEIDREEDLRLAERLTGIQGELLRVKR